MSLRGKVALVTGSTSGIGLGIARVLAGQGADVMLNGFGPAGEIEALRAGLGVEPHRRVDVRDDGVVQHPPVHVEDQRLRAGAVGQLAHVLGEQEVQPAQPVGATDADHREVGEVDLGRSCVEQPLLAVGVAVVTGDAGVRRVREDRAGAR